jgi:hypothetical protein
MKFIRCTYCGVEYIGLQSTSNQGTYNIINSTGAWIGCISLSSLLDVEELKTNESSGGQVSLVSLLGAKPNNLTINF